MSHRTDPDALRVGYRHDDEEEEVSATSTSADTHQTDTIIEIPFAAAVMLEEDAIPQPKKKKKKNKKTKKKEDEAAATEDSPPPASPYSSSDRDLPSELSYKGQGRNMSYYFVDGDASASISTQDGPTESSHPTTQTFPSMTTPGGATGNAPGAARHPDEVDPNTPMAANCASKRQRRYMLWGAIALVVLVVVVVAVVVATGGEEGPSPSPPRPQFPSPTPPTAPSSPTSPSPPSSPSSPTPPSVQIVWTITANSLGNCFIDTNGCINSHTFVGRSQYPNNDGCTFTINQAVTIDQQIWDLEDFYDFIIVSGSQVSIFNDNLPIDGRSFRAGDVFEWASDESNVVGRGTYLGWRLCLA
jgi:hypothetical protein